MLSELSLFPLDDRCELQTNMVWSLLDNGSYSLSRQKLWVRFPHPIATAGLTAKFIAPVGIVRLETSEDQAGTQWRLLAEIKFEQDSPVTVNWESFVTDNIRIHVIEPQNPSFPLNYYFQSLRLLVDSDDLAAIPAPVSTVPCGRLKDISPEETVLFAGHSSAHINEQLGLVHCDPRTNRVFVTASEDKVEFDSPNLRISFSRSQALVTHIGWDTYGKGRKKYNLLSTAHTQGAFPVVMRGCRRISSESGDGAIELTGRTIKYKDIRPVEELAWNYAFTVRENGFSMDIEWNCEKTFHTSELAALRIPFDLYRSVANVLAIPDTTGPSGLVSFPLVINAPNHGVMSVNVKKNSSDSPVYGRISPFRTNAELWLDIMPGVTPLESGVFEVKSGKGHVHLDFELTKIFPHSQDIYGDWQMPPFYSFADFENILGALPNAWLSGLSFRPEICRFANNSVADSAGLCQNYYADIAAYTPMLADGLDSRQFIKIAFEQTILDMHASIGYSDPRHFVMAATSPIDCAWLYVASSGDFEWAEKVRDSILFCAHELINRELCDTGFLANMYSGRPKDPGFMASFWCDSIRCGHIESYTNSHVFRALNRLADLLERLEVSQDAKEARAMAARLKANFMPTFYDSETNQIMMWVDVDGRQYGLRSHMHLGAAVALGLVPDDMARQLLGEYFDQLAASGFQRYEWGLPVFLDPVPEAYYNNWMGKGVEPDGTDQSGVYMNGSIHTHQTYYILQALYKVGMRHKANELFAKMTTLVRDGEFCGGLHSGLDWRHPVDGRASGYEGLLAEQFHFLLAAITGYLGYELTIDGLSTNGPDTERARHANVNFARNV